jgi:hypothetical protein
MSHKRNRNDVDVDSLVKSVPLDKGLIGGLLELNRDELALVLAHVTNKASIYCYVQKARIELPSFYAAKWSDFAKQSGLLQDTSRLRLNSFTTPRYRLPPSFHEAMFENAWRWQDVYHEKVDYTREEARVRLLDPVCEPNSGYMHFL